ncbi:MAG: globin domain-containing protein [Acinetobacter sp.]
MTPQHIELVQATVPVLRENGVALTTYFYNRMLNNHPELKNTFNMDHQSTGRQPRALAAAVLAYAENITNPSVLAKAVERITTKHVSLDIQPDQYAIVGENLLHSISEVLDVPMDSDLIAAWKEAYMQLADILIGVEKSKYAALASETGGWAGWREFEVTAVNDTDAGKTFTLKAKDGAAITPAEAGEHISVRVQVPEQDIRQPQQFSFDNAQHDQYQINVKAEENPTAFSVAHTLINHYQVGDVVEVSAPLKL